MQFHRHLSPTSNCYWQGITDFCSLNAAVQDRRQYTKSQNEWKFGLMENPCSYIEPGKGTCFPKSAVTFLREGKLSLTFRFLPLVYPHWWGFCWLHKLVAEVLSNFLFLKHTHSIKIATKAAAPPVAHNTMPDDTDTKTAQNFCIPAGQQMIFMLPSWDGNSPVISLCSPSWEQFDDTKAIG